MKALVLGSGGREHALAHMLGKSTLISEVFVAPGNAGTEESFINIALNVNDFNDITEFVLSNAVSLVVIGPEDPLVNGIVDYFMNNPKLSEVLIVGPDKHAATLEGSKDFAKDFMAKNNIPTAAYKTFDSSSVEEGKRFLESLNAPYVLKADGLAAGKGVLILDSLVDAKCELENMIGHGKFGNAGSRVVIEEFLKGIELSVFVVTDGENYVILPEAKDYKRIGEGDTGLNTGGMGAVSPVPFAQGEFLNKVEERIIKPTIQGIQKAGMHYKGFVFIGLMNVNGDPYVIEYNVRMGDPETEAVLPRIESDFGQLMIHTAKGTLSDYTLEVTPNTATTVVLVSGGYPEAYEKGHRISGLKEVENTIVFHAGTKKEDESVVTSGGRVLALTAIASSKEKALRNAYKAVDQVAFSKMNYRKDIGQDV